METQQTRERWIDQYRQAAGAYARLAGLPVDLVMALGLTIDTADQIFGLRWMHLVARAAMALVGGRRKDLAQMWVYLWLVGVIDTEAAMLVEQPDIAESPWLELVGEDYDEPERLAVAQRLESEADRAGWTPETLQALLYDPTKTDGEASG